MDVGDFSGADYNPRRIEEEKLAWLGRSMRELGDLGGIVLNRRSGNIVSGHQRLHHVPPETPIVVIAENPDPSPSGTVAVAYIEHEGERWPVRIVDVDDAVEVTMNVGANNPVGVWDTQKLAELLDDLSDVQLGEMAAIDLTGFSSAELEGILGTDDLGVVPPPGSATSVETRVETCPKCGFQWTPRSGVPDLPASEAAAH